MPKTLERTRKAIAKKKGSVDALHQFSRDSKRLHRAQVRDEKLEKIASARRKKDQPYIERTAFFQEALKQNGDQPLSIGVIQELVKTFVHQYDEELDEVKKARRPGQPAKAKEDLLKVKIARLQKEYQNGFLLPVLETQENAALVQKWEGSWSYLTTFKWARVRPDGTVNPASFPPKGDH
ncbi:putative translation machinery-associated protein 16 protein [Rosellinia necatrix]|uniref:Putative translation machinery-associated protein 16 protein n=1 Tax=Rosellinia necatrix TaxID=77044 RepID=A0A1S7UNM0_ROSNE|nr:putative translation machinery-associated protein 16 protein [Rosellinia necatrix]